MQKTIKLQNSSIFGNHPKKVNEEQTPYAKELVKYIIRLSKKQGKQSRVTKKYKVISRLLCKLEKVVSTGSYYALLDKLSQIEREAVQDRKKGPFRVGTDLYTGRFWLFDELNNLKAVPIAEFDPVFLNRDGSINLIWSGKDKGELQLIDENHNTVKVIEFKSDPEVSKEDLCHRWEGVKRQRLKGGDGIKMISPPLYIKVNEELDHTLV